MAGRQHKRTWQRHEAHVAKALGVQRNGNLGGAVADAENDWLAVECKSWAKLPAKVVAALQQAEAAAGERVAVAVLHQVGTRHGGDLVVMRWSSFEALLLGGHAGDRALADDLAVQVAVAEVTNDDVPGSPLRHAEGAGVGDAPAPTGGLSAESRR